MADADFTALKEDIYNHGQREPVIVLDGMVLDGWHRYRACTELGLKVLQFNYGGDDPAAFVLSSNMHRRHLSASQRAAAVVSCAEWQPPNQKAGVKPLHPTASGDAKSRGEATSPHAKTNAEMAAAAKVSERTIQQAKQAHQAGLTDAVKEGAMTVEEAAKIAKGKTEKPAPPASASAPPPAGDYGPDAAELAANEAAEAADRAALNKLLDSDDKLATAVAEVKRLNAVVAAMQSRINGLQNEKNEAVRAAKSWQRKFNEATKGMPA